MIYITARHTPFIRRRGSVVVIVIWTIAIATLITASIQLLGFRQAAFGAEAADRVQARWAARGGIENTISVMADHTARPFPDDAFALVRDLEIVSYGTMNGATYDIQHFRDGRRWPGPMDEHAKININSEQCSSAVLMLLEDMTIDVADAISDWKDSDNEIGVFGVERDWYLSRAAPYEPRNGRVRSVAEIELVAGVWPELMRGEDWNFNQRLDPNEDDDDRTWPPDDPDKILDAGWSQYLTAYTVDGGATSSGEPRLQLKRATPEELMERIGVEELQALALIAYGRNPQNNIIDLASTQLSRIDPTGAVSPSVVNPLIPDLTYDQIRAVLEETSVIHPEDKQPGKMNINTVDEQFLRDLLADEAISDEIIFMRNSRAEGIVSMLELQTIPGLDGDAWRQLYDLYDTRSNVFTISSVGRSEATGTEVEIIVVVDRSTLPVRILEYREQ